VTLRDRGRLVVEDPRKDEKILFELSGSKMQGRYALTRTKKCMALMTVKYIFSWSAPKITGNHWITGSNEGI